MAATRLKYRGTAIISHREVGIVSASNYMNKCELQLLDTGGKYEISLKEYIHPITDSKEREGK